MIKFKTVSQIDLGASISPNQTEEKTAFYWSPAVGVALDVAGGRHSIELGVGYVPQNVRKCDYERIDISSTNPLGRYIETYGTQKVGSLRISLGYTF